jgi:hypothetical protein
VLRRIVDIGTSARGRILVVLPKYDFIGGVHGKHYEAMRKGHTVKINQADGTTLIQHFTYEEGAASLNAPHREFDYGCQGY